MTTPTARRTLTASCLLASVLVFTAACGSGTTPKTHTSTSPSASAMSAADKAKAAAAVKAVDAAGAAYDAKPMQDMFKAAESKDVSSAIAHARQARDAYYAFDMKLRAVSIPVSSQLAMNAVLEAMGKQISDLDQFATVTANSVVISGQRLTLNDWNIGVAFDALLGALGHPLSPQAAAYNKYGAAEETWVLANNTTAPQWTAAVNSGDLAKARSITATQRAATQKFANIVATLPFPPKLAKAVATLKAALAKLIAASNVEYAMTSTAAMKNTPADKASEVAFQAAEAILH